MLEDLFVKNKEGYAIEGFLGEPNSCKVLFVLKEPNTGDYKTHSNCFWMQRVLESKTHVPHSGEYIRTLGIIAAKLLYPEKDPHQLNAEVFMKLLGECAYINVYPFSGLGKAGERYKSTLETLSALSVADRCNPLPYTLSSEFETDYARIAHNRLRIIKDSDCNYVITVCGAFEAIVGKNAKDCPRGISLGSKLFRVCKLYNKTIASYYHPKARVDHYSMSIEHLIQFAKRLDNS